MAYRNREGGSATGPVVAAGVAVAAYALANALVLLPGLVDPSIAFPVARALIPVYFLGGPLLAGLAGYRWGRDGGSLGARFLGTFAGVGAAGYALATLIGVLALLSVPFSSVPVLDQAVTTFSPVALFVSTAVLGGHVGAARSEEAASDRPTGPIAADDDGLDEATAEALDRLRDRYADGRITEAELERRTEAILGTAEEFVDDDLEDSLEAELDAEVTVEDGPDTDLDVDVDPEVGLDADGGTTSASADGADPAAGDGDGDAETDRDRELERN